MIIPITDRHIKYAQEVKEKLEEKGMRVEIDDSSTTMQKKIKNAEEERIPLMLIVGDKEMKAKKVAVRSKLRGDEGVKDLDSVIKKIQSE